MPPPLHPPRLSHRINSQPSSHPGEPPNGPPSLAELLELVPDIGRSSAARSAADGSFDSGSTAAPHAAHSGTGDNYGYNEQQYNDEPAKEYNDYHQHGEAEADMDTALNIARICGRSASSCGYCKGSRAWVLMVDNPDPSTVFSSGGIGARAGGAGGGNDGQVGSNDRGMLAAGGVSARILRQEQMVRTILVPAVQLLTRGIVLRHHHPSEDRQQ